MTTSHLRQLRGLHVACSRCRPRVAIEMPMNIFSTPRNEAIGTYAVLFVVFFPRIADSECAHYNNSEVFFFFLFLFSAIL